MKAVKILDYETKLINDMYKFIILLWYLFACKFREKIKISKRAMVEELEDVNDYLKVKLFCKNILFNKLNKKL